MEYIHGKQTSDLNEAAFATQLYGFHEVLIDIGTGDGRFVQHMAQSCSSQFVIGIDACRENLCRISRKEVWNALYVIANAEALPSELSGRATSITVNFPWGSLLTGLLTSESRVLDGLQRIAQPGAWLEIRLNRSALLQVGWSLEQGGCMMQQALQTSGFDVKAVLQLDVKALRGYPTTWAKRLAHGHALSSEDDTGVLCLQAICAGTSLVEAEV